MTTMERLYNQWVAALMAQDQRRAAQLAQAILEERQRERERIVMLFGKTVRVA